MSDCCIIWYSFLSNFFRDLHCFPYWICHFKFLPAGNKSSTSPHPCQHLFYIYIYINIYICMFNWFPFFWYWLILRTFPIYIDHLNVFYEEMSVEALYTFFKLNYLPRVVYKLSCTHFLYIRYIGPFFSYKVCRYFLSQYWLHFYSVDCWGDYSFFTW